MAPGIDKNDLLATLPPAWPVSLQQEIRHKIEAAGRCFVVLDDDPTGGQTLHGMPVLAAWDNDTLAAEIERSSAFFLLTNSRALRQDEAAALTEQIGRQLSQVEAETGRELVVGSRGDSTLRGHFPAETDALYRGLTGNTERPTYLFVPYFGEGGRFTINHTQYVQQGSHLVPAAETEFARDPTFGYQHSQLPAWLQEKSGGAIRATEVTSVTLDDIRLGGPDAVATKLRAVASGGVAVLNAACDRDLEVSVAGLLDAEAAGSRFLYRTAASFVRVRAGIQSRPLLNAHDLGGARPAGLIVVGSYVERSSQQLEALLRKADSRSIELSVGALLSPSRDSEVSRVAREIAVGLDAGSDVVLYTSRALTQAAGGHDFVSIGKQIGNALCEILHRLQRRPGFLLIKGGSTAHEIAIHGLGLRRGLVLGQLLPGVPVWQLGPESKYPNLPYVVFPGNVGGPDALVEAVNILHGGGDAGLR